MDNIILKCQKTSFKELIDQFKIDVKILTKICLDKSIFDVQNLNEKVWLLSQRRRTERGAMCIIFYGVKYSGLSEWNLSS